MDLGVLLVSPQACANKGFSEPLPMTPLEDEGEGEEILKTKHPKEAIETKDYTFSLCFSEP